MKDAFNPSEHGKLVPDYPCYCVTPDGRVWTRFKRVGKRPRVIGTVWIEKVPETTKKGHKRVELHSLAAGVKPRKFLVHVLVLELYVGPRPEGLEACHADGVPANNSVGNLRWDTQLGNWGDRKRHGRGVEGEKNPGGKKLAESDVAQIRRMRASGKTLKSIASVFNVSIAMISRISRKQAWSHING